MPSAYYWNRMAENTENPKCGCGHRLDEHPEAEACSTNADDPCECSEFRHEEPYDDSDDYWRKPRKHDGVMK